MLNGNNGKKKVWFIDTIYNKTVFEGETFAVREENVIHGKTLVAAYL